MQLLYVQCRVELWHLDFTCFGLLSQLLLCCYPPREGPHVNDRTVQCSMAARMSNEPDPPPPPPLAAEISRATLPNWKHVKEHGLPCCLRVVAIQVPPCPSVPIIHLNLGGAMAGAPCLYLVPEPAMPTQTQCSDEGVAKINISYCMYCTVQYMSWD